MRDNIIHKLHLADLSDETLTGMIEDMAKYSHLSAYRKTWETLAHERADRKQRRENSGDS